MKVHHAFTVTRPRPEVWALFQDVPAVVACLPGARLTTDAGDGRYAGTLGVRLGPIAPSFEVEATVAADPAAWRATITGAGVDRKGGSRGQATVGYALAEVAAGTEVTIDADLALSGPAAQFGRTGLLDEVSRRLVAEFARCLEAKLAAASPAEAAAVQAAEVDGVRLLAGSAWDRLRGANGRR